MIDIHIPAPRVNKLQKTKGGFKKLPNGKRAPAVERPAWLNANQRIGHHQKGAYTALWRAAGEEAARMANTPLLGEAKVLCIIRVHLPRKVTYDAQNYFVTGKAVIDGIVGDYGLLPDDSNEHLVGPLMIEGQPSSDGFGSLSVFMINMNDDNYSDQLKSILESDSCRSGCFTCSKVKP